MNQEKFITVYLPSPEQSDEQKRVVVLKELSYYFLLILKQKGYLLNQCIVLDSFFHNVNIM